MPVVVMAIVSAGFGLILGWASAHHEVARECQRLGAFYVAEKVFECKERQPK